MKKNLFISFILIAITAMMAHSFIPHHEHDNKVCFEKIDCSHSENNSEKKAHPCCLEQQDIIRHDSKDEHDYSCSLSTTCDVHFPPIILFLGNFFEIDIHTSEINFRPYINLYTSVEIFSANSLRGPPQA